MRYFLDERIQFGTAQLLLPLQRGRNALDRHPVLVYEHAHLARNPLTVTTTRRDVPARTGEVAMPMLAP